MIRRKFYLAVLLRVAIIIAASLMLAFKIYQYEKFFTLLASALVILLTAWDLVRITNRFNRELVSFFEALKYEDHSFGLRKLNVPGYPVLSRYMDELSHKLSKVYIDQEIQARFLGSIVDHIQVGLLAVESKGHVVLFNQAAQKLLGMHRISRIDALRARFPEFGNMLVNMKAGDQKMITVYPNDIMRRLSVRSGFFTSRQGQVHLYSFQDVEHEVEEAEMMTWQKLIRVLTHEINNSISPIYSLSDSIRKKMKQIEDSHPGEYSDTSPTGRFERSNDGTSLDRIDEGLQIIQNRSQGLLAFVDKFRSLTPRGSLNQETFPVNELFYRVRILMQEASYSYPRQHDIADTSRPDLPDTPGKDLPGKIRDTNTSSPSGEETFGTTAHAGYPEISGFVYPDSLMLYADQKLVEQILINLVKNAMEAEGEAKAEAEAEVEAKAKAKAKAKEEGEGDEDEEEIPHGIGKDSALEEKTNETLENKEHQKKITMKAFQEEGGKIIEVSDNGPGIPREQLDRIFTPFYTTKKQGSGIGLSLSRQIMRMHGGSITVRSIVGEGTTFRLVFREQ